VLYKEKITYRPDIRKYRSLLRDQGSDGTGQIAQGVSKFSVPKPVPGHWGFIAIGSPGAARIVTLRNEPKSCEADKIVRTIDQGMAGRSNAFGRAILLEEHPEGKGKRIGSHEELGGYISFGRPDQTVCPTNP